LRLRINQKGFTLLEEVIGIFIVAMVAIMVAAMFPLAHAASKINGNHAQAISLAQHKIDQMRAVGYGRLNHDDLEDAEIIDNNPQTQPFEFDSVDQLSTYLPNSSGIIKINDYSTGLKQVQVTITWQSVGKKQTAGTYTLTALIAKE
jgi:type II secretory pathway pseudopilin PulG